MISSGSPQVFVPFGREHYAHHPGDPQLSHLGAYFPNNAIHKDAGEDILDAIRDFSITDHDAKKSDAREQWKLRLSPNTGNIPCDEELYFVRNTAVWSKGTTKNSRHVLMSFTIDQPIEHALWCTFCMFLEPPIGQVSAPQIPQHGDKLPGVCVLSASKLNVFLTNGEEFTIPLPFQITGVWPMKYGLLFERKVTSAVSVPTQKQVDPFPVLFSLIHPLDEITPVVQQTSCGNFHYITSQNQLVVHAFEEPSLVVMYNKQLGVHAVWKLGLAKPEEGVLAVHNLEASIGVLHNQQQQAAGSPVSLTVISGLSRFNTSSQVVSAQGNLSPFRGLSSRTSSPLNRSRPHSPVLSGLTHMATISRSQSPVASGNNLYGYSSPSPLRCSAAIPRTPVSLHGSAYAESSELREPLLPNICLESLWVEPKLSAFRDSTLSGQASKVFFSTDTYGQRFLCLLVPRYSQLRCIKMDESNDQKQLIFGSITPIAARDAVGLENTSLTLVLDPSGSLIVYTGIIKICKVHIPLGVSSLYNRITLTHAMTPVPNLKHDSIVTSSRPPSALDAHFDEKVHLLSPFPAIINESACSLTESSFVEESQSDTVGCTALCDAVQNRISVKYSNGELHRIIIPSLNTSCIVDSALEAFRYSLPKDVGLQIFSKWYTVSRAPGSDVTTPLQQWTMFMSFLLGMMGYDVENIYLLRPVDSEQSSVEVVAKKFKLSDRGNDEDWEYLLQSNHHQVQGQNAVEEIGFFATSPQHSTMPKCCINTQSLLFMHIPTVLYCLHLLYEELKLNKLQWNFLQHFVEMLHFLARDLKLASFVDYYWRDFPNVSKYDNYSSQIDEVTLKQIIFPTFMTSEPPSIFHWLEEIQLEKDPVTFPYIPLISKRTKIIATLYAVLNRRLHNQDRFWEKCVHPLISSVGQRIAFSDEESLQWNVVNCSSTTPWEAVVMTMTLLDVKSSDLDSFPAGVALPIRDAIGRCRKKPPSDWPAKAYILIGREDLAAQLNSSQVTLPTSSSVAEHRVPLVSENKKPVVLKDDEDGMEHMDQELLQLHFSHDLRVQEVRRLLQSSKPARIALVQRPEVSDHEFIEEQERHLYSICIRVMSLPVGRGMFTLRTTKPVVTEALPMPKLCLTGRAPPRSTMIDLTHIDVPANMNLWPLFHNGVAAGLCIAPNASEIDSTWIVYNKPKGNAELPIEHAGFLMALGLNGHLKNLATMNIYDYAVKGHEMTSVGLLLGIAAAKRGTMDLAATKLLSIHVEALLPPTSTELDIPHVVQVAAVLGIGLVYQGTAHRHMAEVLMSEIGRPPGPEMENSTDRESYSLAAGLALGLVTLGKGSNVAGLSDLGMANQLFRYMVGGPKRLMFGTMHEKYKSASYQIKEGDGINVDVTSPGATLALGFMFFGTNDKTVAGWMTAPDTQYLLDFVRPDFLLLRTLSKGLILWDEVIPSSAWVESHVPEIISSTSVLKSSFAPYVDTETLRSSGAICGSATRRGAWSDDNSQAYCNIIAGACMVLGMRFAGSANEEAYNTLLKYAQTFIGLLGKSASEQAGRCTVENCMNVVVLSLAAVMAGTGDLEVLRICRHLHTRIGQSHSHVLYGSHMATHMAIGLLFLGGGRYTLSTTKSAVAAMVCAFFPKFPTHSNDNRYHLQAFRHLYVLAAEPRLIIPRDIDTGHACYTHFAVTFKATKWYGETTLILKAPFLLPQLDLLKEVSINDPRYWPVTFSVHKNWDTFTSLLEKDGTIYVKKRTGCLSYNDDPNGFRSLLAQSLVEDKSGKWTAKPKAIRALTSDPRVKVVLDIFLGNSTGNDNENAGDQLLSHLIYECVTQEKLDAFPSLLTLMQIGTSEVVSSMDMWQIRLITTFCSSNITSNLDSHPVVNREAFVALCSKLDKHCEEWAKDFPDALTSYWKGTALHKIPPSLIPFLIRYKVPPPHKASLIISDKNLSRCLPLLCIQLAPLNFPILTVLKLHHHLNYLLS